jgi:ketosteroid isomerase-like protein
MKKISLFLFAISITGSLLAQQQINQNQQAVQQTVIKMFDALSNRDSASLKDYYTVDILLFENGMTWNIDTLIKKAITLNQSADFKRVNRFDFINTKVDKNIAWVTYTLNSEITRNGKQGSVQWMETVVLVKEKKRWKINLLHSTLIKRN